MRENKNAPPQQQPSRKNPMFKWFVIHLVVIAALVGGLFMLAKLPKGEVEQNETVIYLVRHAEKITGENAGKDPALTEDGKARAKELAGILRTKNITHIYSSDYIRTRDTARPSVEMSGVNIEIYDPRALDAFADKLKKINGNILVVGHSNTIPETVNALGGVGGTPIYEKSEYDRVYVVTITEAGLVQTNLQRYGEKYVTQD